MPIIVTEIRGSISSWRRLSNLNGNLRLLLTCFLAIESLREWSNKQQEIVNFMTRRMPELKSYLEFESYDINVRGMTIFE